MRNGLFTGLVLSFFLSANAQRATVRALLDSARLSWYSDFDKTDEFVRQAERMVSVQESGSYVSDLIQLYDLRIQSCFAFSRFQLWRLYIKKLQAFLEENKGALSPQEYKLFMLRDNFSHAQYLNAIGDAANALKLFVKLLKELKELPQTPEICGWLYVISNDVAQLHLTNGEYEAAINQHLAGISYLECTGDPSYTLVYRNIGLAYFKKKDYKRAGAYLRLAEDSLQKPLKKKPAEFARIALSLYEIESSYYERVGFGDSAMLSMKKAIPLLKLGNVDDSFKGRISLGLGNLNLHRKKFMLAQSYFERAENFFLNSPEDQPIHLSGVYLAKANLFESLGKTANALMNCNKALARLTLNFKPDADGNPALTEILSKRQVFAVLQKKSLLLEKFFDQTKDTKVLTGAFRTNQLSLALLDSTANEVSLDKDKVNLAEESYNAFEDGIRIAYALYKQTNDKQYLTKCFSMMDKSKGIVLLERLRLVDRFVGINPELVNREKEIKSELLLTEHHLYELENKNERAADLAVARERYATLKRDYAYWMKKIKNEAPDYYRLRFDRGTITEGDIQNKLLDQGEAMLEYFVGDSIIAVAGFTREKQVVIVKKLPADFLATINNLRTVITGGESEGHPDFESPAAALYDFLIKDAVRQFGPGVNSLTIIPDGLLGYLPFEVLRKNEGGKMTYLIEDFSIRYAYSATYLHEQHQKKTAQAGHFFAGFVSSNLETAISYDRSATKRLTSLPGAEKEVKAITELLGTNFSVFSPARKSDFKEHAADYQVLHLAMHSQVNDENPMLSALAFSAAEGDTSEVSELTAIELYNMSLKSDLAVLSACNTGFGTLHRGEGIMSFSRAFAYAGVPSAVISLWQVPDKATAKIMVNFYRYLKAGEGKDRALQHTKADFIHNYPQMAAPLYWAGFILTGNKEPLAFPASGLWYWIIAGVLVALSVVVAALRLKKSPGGPAIDR